MNSMATNVAIGVPIESQWNPENSEPVQNLNDGNANTSAQFNMGDPDVLGQKCDRGVWIRLDLTKLNIVTGARLRWASDARTSCAVCYAMLLSAEQSPGDPSDPNNKKWVRVGGREEAVGSCNAVQSIPVDRPVQARWVAFILYEDANDRWFSWDVNQWEYFKLAEIEVIGQDPNVPIFGGESDRCP